MKAFKMPNDLFHRAALLISIAAVLGAAAWFVARPGYEPLITAALGLAGILFAVHERVTKPAGTRSATWDSSLLSELSEIKDLLGLISTPVDVPRVSDIIREARVLVRGIEASVQDEADWLSDSNLTDAISARDRITGLFRTSQPPEYSFEEHEVRKLLERLDKLIASIQRQLDLQNDHLMNQP